MRKLFAILLAVAMMATMSMTAFAAEGSENINTNNGSVTIDIAATYNEGQAASEVISVDVKWGAMTFEYTAASAGTWNPDTHKYDGVAEAKWTASGNTITVTNHSNTAVDAQFVYTKSEQTQVTGKLSAVSGTFENNTLSLASAENTAVTAAPSGEVKLELSGDLEKELTGTTVGTVTITIINK